MTCFQRGLPADNEIQQNHQASSTSSDVCFDHVFPPKFTVDWALKIDSQRLLQKDFLIGMFFCSFVFKQKTTSYNPLYYYYYLPSVELFTLYLLACQVRVTVGGLGLWCFVYVTSFEREFTTCVYCRSFE